MEASRLYPTMASDAEIRDERGIDDEVLEKRARSHRVLAADGVHRNGIRLVVSWGKWRYQPPREPEATRAVVCMPVTAHEMLLFG